MAPEESCYVFTRRMDGLGARLFALVNAMVVSDEFNIPLRVVWPRQSRADNSFHVVDDPYEIFSERFVNQYFHEYVEDTPAIQIYQEKTTRSEILDATKSLQHPVEVKTCDGILDFGQTRPAKKFRAAFKRIEFSKKVTRARKVARNSIPKPYSVIHIRRGDLVHGEYRRRSFNEKYVPLALTRRIIDKLSKGADRVILLSDDPDVVKKLDGVDFIGESVSFGGESDALDAIEQTFFEMEIIERAERVVGPPSAFTAFPASLSGTPIFEVGAVVDQICRDKNDLHARMFNRSRSDSIAVAEVLRDIYRNPHYSNLEKAKDLQWVAEKFIPNSKPMARSIFLNRAAFFDPDSEEYYFSSAFNFLANSNQELCEQYLRMGSWGFFRRKSFAVEGLSDKFTNMVGDRLHQMLHIDDTQAGPYSLAWKASAHLRSGEKHKAKAINSLSLLKERLNPQINAQQARLLISLGEQQEAQVLLEATLRKRPEYAILHAILGEIIEKNLGHSEAIGYYRRAHALAPDASAISAKLAWSLSRVGKKSEALSVCSQYDTSDLHESHVAYRFSRTYAVCGDKPDAKRFALRALKLPGAKPFYFDWHEELTQ